MNGSFFWAVKPELHEDWEILGVMSIGLLALLEVASKVKKSFMAGENPRTD